MTFKHWMIAWAATLLMVAGAMVIEALPPPSPSKPMSAAEQSYYRCLASVSNDKAAFRLGGVSSNDIDKLYSGVEHFRCDAQWRTLLAQRAKVEDKK